MRKITFFKTMLAAVMLLVGSVGVWATTVNHTFSATSGSIDSNISFTTEKNSSATVPAFNTQLRLYYSANGDGCSVTLIPANGAVINQVKISAVTNYTPTVQYNEDGGSDGTATLDGTTYTISGVAAAASLKIRNGNTTNTQLRITAIEVTYTTADPNMVIAPVITVSGAEKSANVYYNSAQVSLTSATAGSSVYYTLNGDAPTTASTMFSAPFPVTSTTTVKAIAVKSGMNNSAISERTITIVAPATATVPYTEAFNNTLGDWYAFQVAGAKPWGPSANGATVNGYGGGDVESWLISPQFTSPLAGLAFTFNYASRYPGNPLLVKYSTNYSGYGNPTAATWVNLTSIAAPEVQDNNYTVKASGNINIPVSGMVHLALVYDTEANYSDWRITNASVSVAQAPNAPSITVTEVSVPAMSAEVGQSDTETITVSGVNLSENISIEISGTNAAYFTANPATLTAVSGSVTDAAVVITYAPLAAGSHSATLTVSSAGAISVTRSLTGTATTPPVQMTPPDVIISEVYGGGGNSGATLKNDFIELYNTTSSEVNISGWSVQYFSATGTTLSAPTNKFVLPEGSRIPGKSHFLIQAAAGTGGTEDLVSPDAVSEIAAAGSAGKVILYTSDVDNTITDINSITGHAAFKDYVPYGTTTTPVWGAAMSAGTANATSASRKLISGSYSYSQNIGHDFEVVTPTPQNTLWTSVQNPKLRTDVYTVNGTIRFNATAGQTVEVYTVIGQQIISTLATDGLNIIPVKAKGMMVVRIGGKSAKVVM